MSTISRVTQGSLHVVHSTSKTNNIHSRLNHSTNHSIMEYRAKMWSPVSETGGYDYQFVEEPPDSLKCLICLLVTRDPQQHGGCGKLFCQSCIAAYRVMRNECPHCRQPLTNSQQTTIFNDFKSKPLANSSFVLLELSNMKYTIRFPLSQLSICLSC